MKPYAPLLLLALAAPYARAEGGDYSNAELKTKGHLVKGQGPVAGYWVNWEDTFFYSGDAASLNRFLDAYGKIKGQRLRVVLHPGPKRVRMPWDRADRETAVDWSYYVWNTGSIGKEGDKPAPSQVDVYLGGLVNLKDLKVPANVEVVSGGEIEKFIAAHAKKK
jgi:hypothetical protein